MPINESRVSSLQRQITQQRRKCEYTEVKIPTHTEQAEGEAWQVSPRYSKSLPHTPSPPYPAPLLHLPTLSVAVERGTALN